MNTLSNQQKSYGMVRATTPSPILTMPVLSLQFFQIPLPYVYPSVKSLYCNWISKKNNWWKFGAFCPHCCILFMKSKFCSALSSNECISQRIAGESFCIISEIVVKCQRIFRCDSNNRKISWVLPKLEFWQFGLRDASLYQFCSFFYMTKSQKPKRVGLDD